MQAKSMFKLSYNYKMVEILILNNNLSSSRNNNNSKIKNVIHNKLV